MVSGTNGSYSNVGHTYAHNGKGEYVLNGERNFQVKEIECYEVIGWW